MTAGPRLKRRNYGRGHGYTIDGRKAIGVTTVLNAMPKDALINWSARVTAEAAVDRWDELGELPPTQRLKELQDARWNVNREATGRGTEIHALGEKVAHGEAVDVPPEHVGPVEAYARFLDRWDVQMVATEAPCANTALGYAGTLDSVATIGNLPETDGAPVMLDLKTGRGVYESTALQLAAYAECDIWQPDGPDSEAPMLEISGLYVAHILADDVHLLPVEWTPQLLLQFRYLMATTRWIADSKEAPPIGAPLVAGDTAETTATHMERLDGLIDQLTERRAVLAAAEAGASA